MAIVAQGFFKFFSATAAFLFATGGGPSTQSTPSSAQTAAIDPVTPQIKVDVAPAPAPAVPEMPAADPVRSVFDNYHTSFLQRVATGQQTAFNACFTRTGNPVVPANVDRIRDGSLLRRAVYTPSAVDYNLAPIIVIDPGHASEGDPGAMRNGLRETAIVNAVAVQLKNALEVRGADVVGTRAPVAEDITLTSRYRFKDQDRALQWRAGMVYEFAKNFPDRPVIGISLHADTSASAASKGAGIFYYAGTGAHSAPSAALAQSIAAHYRTPARHSIVKSENFAFPRCQEKSTPVVLVELGYMTNGEDFKFLQSAAHNPKSAERIADKLADGIFGFIRQRQREQIPTTRIAVAAAEAPPTLIY